MFTRLLRTLFWLLLWLLVVLLGPGGLLLFADRLNPGLAAMLACLWLALACLSLPVVLQVLLRRVWLFAGSGVAVDEEALRGRLLAINNLDAPVRVVERRRRLVVGWRHDEVQWCELLSRRGLSGLYELHLHIDPRTRTVTLMDRRRPVQFLFCPEGVKTGRPRVVLPFLRLRANRLGSVEQYATMEPFQYDFLPHEIKAPVLGTILASGWNVRFSLI
jgi:hypothetical protein